jgi:hypothetical protein
MKNTRVNLYVYLQHTNSPHVLCTEHHVAGVENRFCRIWQRDNKGRAGLMSSDLLRHSQHSTKILVQRFVMAVQKRAVEKEASAFALCSRITQMWLWTDTSCMSVHVWTPALCTAVHYVSPCHRHTHVSAPSPQSTDLLDDSRLSDKEKHRLLRKPNVHHHTHNIPSMDDIHRQSMTVTFQLTN